MKIPVMRGVIDQRILVNYRVDWPNVLARILLRPFRPKLVNGAGMAGSVPDSPETHPAPAPALLPGIGLRERRTPHRCRVGPPGPTAGRCVHPPAGHILSAEHRSSAGRLFPGPITMRVFRSRNGAAITGSLSTAMIARPTLLVEGHVSTELPSSSIFGPLITRRVHPPSLNGGRWALLGDGQTWRALDGLELSQLFLAGPTPGRPSEWSPALLRGPGDVPLAGSVGV